MKTIIINSNKPFNRKRDESTFPLKLLNLSIPIFRGRRIKTATPIKLSYFELKVPVLTYKIVGSYFISILISNKDSAVGPPLIFLNIFKSLVYLTPQRERASPFGQEAEIKFEY